MNEKTLIPRRQFLKYAGFAMALSPLLRLPSRAAEATDKVNESDPVAQGLGYRHDAELIDAEKFPRSLPVGGVRPVCANCVLYQGNAEEPWAGCPIFANKQVRATGWCTAWAARPK